MAPTEADSVPQERIKCFLSKKEVIEMAKVDIVSGFLGAGKTTLIKKLIKEADLGEKVVLIENEYGEIGIDGGFMKDSGIVVDELNSGCICCTLVGDFAKALTEVIDKYDPDRIVIEPSGVGKLSDVIKAVEDIHDERLSLNSFTTIVDAGKAKMYLKNFGEFFSNQVQYARTIILSRTQLVNETKVLQDVELLKAINDKATIITTPWDELDGKTVLNAMEKTESFEEDLLKEAVEEARKHQEEHDHEHHHHDGEECCCHHHHDDDEECCHHHHDEDEECCHHHHDEDEECCHHHHDEDEECCHHHDHDDEEECPHCHEKHGHDEECHHHDHDHEHHHDHEHEHHHHHHHHADEVFDSWGNEGPKKYDRESLDKILNELAKEDGDYGFILRSKGIVPSTDGTWLHFDLTPGEYEIREGSSDVTGRLCVIGSKLDTAKLKTLFEL